MLLPDSYWRQADVMVGVLWVPASGRPPNVLILWRQPTGIGDVCSTPSRVLSEHDTTDIFIKKQQQTNHKTKPDDNKVYSYYMQL